MYLHTIKSSKNCKQLFSTYENGFKNFLGKKKITMILCTKMLAHSFIYSMADFIIFRSPYTLLFSRHNYEV